MTRFAEVEHQEWIAAPVDTVRAQFADLQHHIDANVHPKLRFEIVSQSARRARYVQEVKLLGIRQRDVFEREIAADGSITDTSVEGFNKDGSLRFCFRPQNRRRPRRHLRRHHDPVAAARTDVLAARVAEGTGAPRSARRRAGGQARHRAARLSARPAGRRAQARRLSAPRRAFSLPPALKRTRIASMRLRFAP